MILIVFFFFLMIRRPPRSTPFPTRRSSDLGPVPPDSARFDAGLAQAVHRFQRRHGLDRKSTRLNSSHLVISYAVFCLKKKKKSINCYNVKKTKKKKHLTK